MIEDQKKAEMYRQIEAHYRENFQSLVKRYAHFIHHRERAEDIIQEAYCRALQYWESYDTERPFDKWFNSIISSALKENKRTETMHGMVDISEAMDVPIKPAAIPAVIVNQVMKRINEHDQQSADILRMVFLKHMRPVEIAKVVDANANAIRKLVQRFREEIKRDYRWVL